MILNADDKIWMKKCERSGQKHLDADENVDDEILMRGN